MRKISKIILHSSGSTFGNASLIDKWHRQRPNNFRRIGYHYVITNGIIRSHTAYRPEYDGRLEKGRSIEEVGAHCKGYNTDSIGICLIGEKFFTLRQFDVLRNLLNTLMELYNLQPWDLKCHYEYNAHKTCPTFKIEHLRGIL